MPATVSYNNKTYKVVAIGAYVFYNCGKLTAVNLPNTLLRIGSWAFSKTGLTSLTTPASLTTIKIEAFSYCKALQWVKLAEGLTSMTGSAFLGCTGLTMVNLPSTYTSVGQNCFNGCSNLQYVSLGGNPDFAVGKKAFENDNNMQKVLLVGECADPSKINKTGNAALFGAELYVPNTTPEMMDKYRALGFKKVTPIVNEQTIAVAGYGSQPTAALNLKQWDEPVDIKKIYYSNYPDGKCPAGNYKHEPITIELKGGLLEGVKVEIFADFQIEPLTLRATPYPKTGDYAFTYGQPISFNAYNWGINFNQSQFYPGEDWHVIKHEYIHLELYKDGKKVNPNAEGFYDAGEYQVSGWDEKYEGGTYDGLSKCNSTYKFEWVNNSQRVTIKKAENPGLDDQWAWQGDVTVYVGEQQSFTPAQAKTEVRYATDNDQIAEVVEEGGHQIAAVRGLREGDTKLLAWALEDNNYQAMPYSRAINVHVIKRASDMDWPVKPKQETTAGGECLEIGAATSAARQPIVYTVQGKTLQVGEYMVTDYARVMLNEDGTLTVCGTHQGKVKIQACAQPTNEREGTCREVEVEVKPAKKTDLPAGFLTWGTADINGVVDQTATYDAPKADFSKLVNVQTGEQYKGIKLTLELVPETYALVNDDWKALDGSPATLACKHATNGERVILRLTAHDEGDGAEPIYNDKILRRHVVIAKKKGDASGLTDPAFENGIDVKVEEVRALPNPAVGDQEPCDVLYELNTTRMELRKSDCTTSVVAHQEGQATVTVTIPGDDDTEDVVGSIVVRATRNSRNVAWTDGPLTVQVDQTLPIAKATQQLRDQAQPTPVPDDAYSLSNANAIFATDKPSVTGQVVGLTELTLELPQTNVYNAYSRKLQVNVVKKDADIQWPGEGTVDVEAGGECEVIDGATSGENAKITYTVAESSTTSAVNGVTTITTQYATIEIQADGKLRICGKSEGTVHLSACAEETDRMEAGCKEVTVEVTFQGAEDIPAGYITWSGKITGTVDQDAPFTAPVKNSGVLVSQQTHAEYTGIVFTMTLEPADRAVVTDAGANGAWTLLNGENTKLECKNATKTDAILTLRAHDNGVNGATPLYKDRTWTRPVQIDKKHGDRSGFSGDEWTNGIDVKVLVAHELPNPAVGVQDKCAVRYEPLTAEFAVTVDPNTCAATVTASKPITEKVLVTIPGDDNTLDESALIEVRATRSNRQVDWITELDAMKVGDGQTVKKATWQEVNKTGATEVEAGAYKIDKTAIVDFATAKPDVTAKAIGTAYLTLTLDETDVYEGFERSIPIVVTRKDTDFNWPTQEEESTEVGGDCLELAAATGAGEITYTVREETSHENVGDVTIITTDYATVQINADGSLTICGKHRGTLHITACSAQTDDTEGACKTIVVDVVQGDLRDLPEGYITWGTADIEGVVDQTAKYDAPMVDATKLVSDQTGKQYQGIELTLTLDPADKAIVNGDWKKLDGTEATLDCKHATQVPATLTLLAHDNGDNGADPIYRDTYWTRNVIISKRTQGVDWENLPDWPANGIITALVDEVKPLPNPNKDGDHTDVVFSCADPSVTFPNEAEVKPTQDGNFVILITLPETDDVLGDSREIKLVVDKRTYDVDWDTTPLTTQVGSSVEVPVATVTPWDGDKATVEAQYYTLPGGSSKTLHFADGEHPSVANATFEVAADAPGDAVVNLTLPETRVYKEYNESVPVGVAKKTVTLDYDGEEWYRGEIGDKLTLPVATAATYDGEHVNVLFEMLPGYADYVRLLTLPDGSAEAQLLKVIADARGVVHAIETALTALSNETSLHFEVRKKSNDLQWSVGNPVQGVTETTIVLPLATTTYGDPTAITYDLAPDPDGTATATIDAVDEEGVHITLGHTGELTLIAKIAEGDNNEAAEVHTTLQIKAGEGDLNWDVRPEYNVFVGDLVELSAPTSTYVQPQDIYVFIPELDDDEWSRTDDKLTFTPEVGGDLHIYVTVPDTPDRTGKEASAVVHVSKITPIIEWEVTSWPEEKLKWQDNVVIDMPDATSPNFEGEFHYMSTDESIAKFQRTPEGQLQLVMQGGHGPVNLYVYTDATNRYEDGQTDEVEAYIEGHAAIQAISETKPAKALDNNTYDLLGRRVIGKPQPGVYVKAGKLIQVK